MGCQSRSIVIGLASLFTHISDIPSVTSDNPIRYITEDIPATGVAYPIADGVSWIRMPLPFQLDHINLWLIDEEDGWTVVDTGVSGKITQSVWQDVFAGLNQAAGGGEKKPVRLVCTHVHPDHMGSAGWICRNWGIDLTTTKGEWDMGNYLSRKRPDAVDELEAFFHWAGCRDDEVLAISHLIIGTHVLYDAMPDSYTRVAEDDEIVLGGRSWRVMIGLGHAFEHACLYCAELGVLIGGDQILPRITPTILLLAHERDKNPLADFLESNLKFNDLPADTLVLPSHNAPFVGLHDRLTQYEDHHAQRLDDTLKACREPATARQIADHLYNVPDDPHGLFFAVGEALSHIRYQEREGRLTAAQRSDGVELYTVRP